MLKIQVKTKERNFFLPVPYALLNIGVTFLSSEFLRKQLNKRWKVRDEGEERRLEIDTVEEKLIEPVNDQVDHQLKEQVHGKKGNVMNHPSPDEAGNKGKNQMKGVANGGRIQVTDSVEDRANDTDRGNIGDKVVEVKIPPYVKKELKMILKELKRYRGLEIISLRTKDGTKISIKL